MRKEVSDFVISNVSEHPQDIAAVTAAKFSISRQTAVNYLKALVSEGLINAAGTTRARKYNLRNFVDESYHATVTPNMEEDVVWREKMLPFTNGLKANIVDICQYGFTEIFQNVIDHSESKTVLYGVKRNAVCVSVWVIDHGVGIFNKIQQYFKLEDPRQALLELAKGKLTSDPKRHSGEGIFFTSRMFDSFEILSKPLYYVRESVHDSDWLVESHGSEQKGTFVVMEISPFSQRTVKGVFDAYTSQDNFGFAKTHVPIKLARYVSEQMVSRSQAKRILARFEKFNEVLLDFTGVETIGQAFADEIFRVYASEHPSVVIIAANTTPNIDQMIQRARANL